MMTESYFLPTGNAIPKKYYWKIKTNVIDWCQLGSENLNWISVVRTGVRKIDGEFRKQCRDRFHQFSPCTPFPFTIKLNYPYISYVFNDALSIVQFAYSVVHTLSDSIVFHSVILIFIQMGDNSSRAYVLPLAKFISLRTQSSGQALHPHTKAHSFSCPCQMILHSSIHFQ